MERRKSVAVEQRMQRELEACRTPEPRSSEVADLDKREADLAAALAQVHLRETGLQAQRDEI